MKKCCISSRGFSLVELLVVIVIIAILASLLLPALSKAKLKTQGIQCMNGHRQLTIAWKMYTDDNRDVLLFASDYGYGYGNQNPYLWVSGGMDFNPNNPSNWDTDKDIKQSPIWPYCGGSTIIWRCPADTSSVVVNGQRLPRVRSMSMNLWVGGFIGYDGGLSGGDNSTLGGNLWKVYLKMTDITDPGPARTFLLLDMREDSIDVGNFATDMRGWPDAPGGVGFYDLPGSYHHRAGGLSFVDGHAEIHPWRDARTMPPVVKGGLLYDQFSSPGNPDVIWLQEHCTRKLQ